MAAILPPSRIELFGGPLDGQWIPLAGAADKLLVAHTIVVDDIHVSDCWVEYALNSNKQRYEYTGRRIDNLPPQPRTLNPEP